MTDKPSDAERLYAFAVQERLCPCCVIRASIRLIARSARSPRTLSALPEPMLDVVSAVLACPSQARKNDPEEPNYP